MFHESRGNRESEKEGLAMRWMVRRLEHSAKSARECVGSVEGSDANVPRGPGIGDDGHTCVPTSDGDGG